jgi:hypothetical protein
VTHRKVIQAKVFRVTAVFQKVARVYRHKVKARKVCRLIVARVHKAFLVKARKAKANQAKVNLVKVNQALAKVRKAKVRRAKVRRACRVIQVKVFHQTVRRVFRRKASLRNQTVRKACQLIHQTVVKVKVHKVKVHNRNQVKASHQIARKVNHRRAKALSRKAIAQTVRKVIPQIQVSLNLAKANLLNQKVVRVYPQTLLTVRKVTLVKVIARHRKVRVRKACPPIAVYLLTVLKAIQVTLQIVVKVCHRKVANRLVVIQIVPKVLPRKVIVAKANRLKANQVKVCLRTLAKVKALKVFQAIHRKVFRLYRLIVAKVCHLTLQTAVRVCPQTQVRATQARAKVTAVNQNQVKANRA